MSAQPAPLPRARLTPELRLVHGDAAGFSNIKTKCNEKLTEQFCALIRKGLPPDGVCDFLGVSSSSFWKWLRCGEIYNTTARRSRLDLHAPYGHFVAEFKKAFAEYRLERVERLHEKGNKDWYRELAVLERRDRKSFGRNDPQGGSVEDYDPDESFL